MNGDFPVYTAKKQVSLFAGDSLALDVQHAAGNAAYVWLHDGKPIAGADAQQLTLRSESAADAGTYSVQITSPAGTVKTADICEVLTVYDSVLSGDVNADGELYSRTMAEQELRSEAYNEAVTELTGDLKPERTFMWRYAMNN